jgi:hypothetical protein
LRKATGFIELIVAALILSAVVAGLLSSFISVRSYITHSNKRLVSANLGRSILSRLGGCVSEASWNVSGTALYAPPGQAWQPHTAGDVAVGLGPIDNINYDPAPAGSTGYRVRRVETPAGDERYREVEVNITYPD